MHGWHALVIAEGTQNVELAEATLSVKLPCARWACGRPSAMDLQGRSAVQSEAMMQVRRRPTRAPPSLLLACPGDAHLMKLLFALTSRITGGYHQASHMQLPLILLAPLPFEGIRLLLMGT